MQTENLARLERESQCRENYVPFHVEDSHIYMYNGHGGDICNPDGTLVIKEVPPGCIYVTQTLCGIINRAGVIFKEFSNPTYAHIWRDPVTHVEELKALLGDNPSLHIHLPGCSYVDNMFYPVSEVGQRDKPKENREKIVINYSGLMRLDTALSMTDDERELFDEGKYEYYGSVMNADVNTGDILKYFSKSVYPRINYKSSRMPLFVFKGLANRHKRSVSSLMAEFPGIHFNFLCRSIRDPKCTPAILRRRRFSAEVYDTLYNGIARFIQVINDNGDERGAEYIEYLRDTLIQNKNLAKIHTLIELAEKKWYLETKKELQEVYGQIAMDEFEALLDAKASPREFKDFIDSLESSEIQGPTGSYLLAYAFNRDMRFLIRYLCRLGAPTEDMERAFANLQPTMNRKTKTRKRIYKLDCQRARKTFLNRRTRNRSNSFRSNE